MNQILDYDVDGNNSYNNGKNKKEKKNNNGGKTPLSDRIVKVFAFLMIIFAIALITSGVMSILKNKDDSDAQKNNSTDSQNIKAEINAELDPITGKVIINIDSPITISKMIYSWDKDHDNVVSGEKQSNISEEIVAPYGEHILHIQVIDEQNNKTLKDFPINSATGTDTTQPEITLAITEDKKLLVSVTDDTSIAYVTYTWNEGETVTMTPEDENLKEYEFTLDIPKGKNTIVVVAVDGSDISNAKTTSKVLEGVTKPEINYGFLDSAGAVLQIMCSHEIGIKNIYYTFNGQAYEWNAPEDGEAQKELSFTQESIVGHNSMTITVTSVDGNKADFNPVWDYGVSEQNVSDNNQIQNTIDNTVANNIMDNSVLNNTIDNSITNTIDNSISNQIINN